MDQFEEFDRKLKLYARKEPFPLPEDFPGRVFRICASLEEKTVNTRKRALRRWIIGIAAALAIFVAVPNLSAPAAQAMEKIPVLGDVVKVITLRRYKFEGDTTHADVSVPEVQGSGKAATSVNRDVKEYTDRLVKQFKKDVAAGGKHEALDISYKVVTNSDDWFTLRVNGLEIQASGYEFSKIYNIDKTTDKMVTLRDLFKSGSDWKQALNAELIRQMKAQMADTASGKTYFLEDFKGVKADQNYYFDRNGDLVVAFDEYEIAPGCMGPVEFTVAKAVYQSYLKK